MKKLRLFILAAACLGMTNTFAATEGENSLELVEMYQFKFWDNFYFGLKGGAQAIINGPHSSEFGKNLSPAGDIYAGVDFNPFWGTRVQFGYARQKAWDSLDPCKQWSTFTDNHGESYNVNLVNFDVTPTLNLTNAICGYSWEKERKFNAYAFLGVGIMHAWAKSTNSDDAYLTGGFYATYKVAPKWSITAEVADRFCSSAIIGYVNGHPTYHFVSGKLGVMYRLSDKRFKKFSTQPYLDVIESQKFDLAKKDNELSEKDREIARLQGDINAKNAEIERLLKEKGIAAVPELPIFFKINSTEVDQKSKYILEKYCECLKKIDADYDIEVLGYCDLATGSRAYNEKLKVKRAVKVADIISGEFGIPASKIIADGGDLDNSPYASNKPLYSRVAVVKFVKK